MPHCTPSALHPGFSTPSLPSILSDTNTKTLTALPHLQDFDPAEMPRGKRAVNNEKKVRMMLPMSVRCNTCGNFMYKGTKFNCRMEDVAGETYLVGWLKCGGVWDGFGEVYMLVRGGGACVSTASASAAVLPARPTPP